MVRPVFSRCCYNGEKDGFAYGFTAEFFSSRCQGWTEFFRGVNLQRENGTLDEISYVLTAGELAWIRLILPYHNVS